MFAHLGEVHTELFEGLQQTGITDLLNHKDTLGRFVPCQPLACWILNVPGGQNKPQTSAHPAQTPQ